jgi:hypothetical protein
MRAGRGVDRVEADWTAGTYARHNEAIRVLQGRVDEERDRRYAEVKVEREKALLIKETADRDAMELARERQRDKEQQQDVLRDKSGIYATTEAVTDMFDKISNRLELLGQQVSDITGSAKGSALTKGNIAALISGGGVLVIIAQYLSTGRL